MGHELLCSVRSGGKTTQGKALLETNEIIFRGDLSTEGSICVAEVCCRT